MWNKTLKLIQSISEVLDVYSFFTIYAPQLF